jgi:hypothetical protein
MRAPPSWTRVAGRALALAVVLPLFACGACHGGALSAPGPDASTAAAVCANLSKLGCALGSDPACVSRVELSVGEARVLASQVTCAGTATTKEALAACSPFFACP